MSSIALFSFLFLGISLWVSYRLRSKFAAYNQMPLSSGMSGREVAQKMLRDNGIYDVRVESVEGVLSDHYNPMDKTVNLSADVYNNRTIAAAAVAAHECGHAVQHATAYRWLMFRSRMVPVVQVSSMFIQWVLLAGVLLINVFPQLLLIGILLFTLTTVFALVTLPVEFDASRRALAWLGNARVADAQEQPQAKDALHWAAMTYVVSAIASLVTLLQYVLMFLGSRDRD
ncbi:MAG: zinc metallopeptidase [Bacteroidetes bacterium]|nr:zinc metallopeptidase [Bacteroidota bacterium]